MNERPDIDADNDSPEELSRVYSWEGKPLEPFSAGRQMALQRINVIGGSTIESAAALVRLCLMPPEQVASIRGEGCTRFLVDLETWMESESVGLGTARKEKTDRLLKVYDEILNELYKAEEVIPDVSGAPVPGN